MIYLGEQIETAKVTDDAIDLWETFTFSTGLEREEESLFATVVANV